MFENVKVGDPVSVINHLGSMQLATVVHITKKQIHVQSSRYKDAIEKYSREDGQPIGKDNCHFFIVEVDDPRVVRKLATTFYCDFLGSLSFGISASYGQSLTPEDVTKRLEDIRSLVDETIKNVNDLDRLVFLYR